VRERRAGERRAADQDARDRGERPLALAPATC
jgi:hypothetical protein